MAVLVSDSFNRVNSTTNLGTTDSYSGGTAQTWVAAQGTWGISGNRGYTLVNSTAFAVVDAGISDNITVSADLTYTPSSVALLIRYIDLNAHIYVRIASPSIALFKFGGGSGVQLGSYTLPTPASEGSTYNVKITAVGTTITVTLDGVDVMTVTEPVQSTGTMVGLRSNTTPTANGFYDNFIVSSIFPESKGTSSVNGNAVIAKWGVLVSDSFNRADNATTLGATDSYSGGTAKVWVTPDSASYGGGGTFGVINSQAYLVSGNSLLTVFDAGVSDYDLSVTKVTAKTFPSADLIVRYIDADNHMQVTHNGTNVKIFKRVANAWSSFASVPLTVNDNDIMKVRCAGDTITVYNNNIQAISVTLNPTTDTILLTGKSVGIVPANTNNRFDNFIVEGYSTQTGSIVNSVSGSSSGTSTSTGSLSYIYNISSQSIGASIVSSSPTILAVSGSSNGVAGLSSSVIIMYPITAPATYFISPFFAGAFNSVSSINGVSSLSVAVKQMSAVSGSSDGLASSSSSPTIPAGGINTASGSSNGIASVNGNPVQQSSGVLASDSFNRSDSSTLGTTDSYNGGTARTWINIVDGLAISGNQAYNSSTINAFSVVDAGNANVDVSLTVSNHSTGEEALYFRVTDDSNKWRIIESGPTMYLQKYVSAVKTTVSSFNISAVNGDIWRLSANGDAISVYINSVLKLTATDSFNNTATKHGFGQGITDINARFDNFQIAVVSSGIQAVTGTINSTSSVTPSPIVKQFASGSISGVANVVTSLAGMQVVSGTVDGMAGVSITAVLYKQFAIGSVVGTSSTSNTPKLLQNTNGSASGVTTVTGALLGAQAVSGTIGCVANVTANPTFKWSASGSSSGITNIVGSFSGMQVANGTASGTSDVTNTTAKVVKPIVGLSDGVSSVSSVVSMKFYSVCAANGKTDISGLSQSVNQVVVNNASKTIQRWKLGPYQLTYNPKAIDRNIRATVGEEITANGFVSNPNKFFDDEINFTIDLYDKPTYFSESALKNFADNYYVGVTEKRYNGELFCLKSDGTFDVINKEGNGGVTRTATITNVTGTPIAIAHMDNNKLATIFTNAGVAYLNICDELGVQIGKYTISDADYVNASSIMWDYDATLYILSKHGKIFTSNPNNGATAFVYQSDDFSGNKALNISAYSGMHLFNNFIGFIGKNSIYYMDKNFARIYSTEIPITNAVGKITSLSFGYASGDFYALSKNTLVKIYPNTCGIDITTIKSQIANGVVQISDEKNATLFVVIKSMGIDRKRNKQDSRYELKFSGKIMS